MVLPEADLFLLAIPDGRYLCFMDMELFPWAVLTSEQVMANLNVRDTRQPGVIRAFGPIPILEEEGG